MTSKPAACARRTACRYALSRTSKSPFLNARGAIQPSPTGASLGATMLHGLSPRFASSSVSGPLPYQGRAMLALRPACANWIAGTAPWLFKNSEILLKPAICASSHIPVSPCVMRPRFSTAVASTKTMPAPPCANLPRCTRCQSPTWPSSAEYWHIGETTMRLRASISRSLIFSNNIRFGSPGGFLQRQRGGGALAAPLLLVDHLAEEVELDGHVVRVLEEDLEQLRVRKAAKVHLHLVLPDALAHFPGVLREERDVVDRARAGGAFRVLLQQELVADPVRLLRGEVHADRVARLEPVARKAEVRPLRGGLQAEDLLVEFLRALEVLRDDEIVVDVGDGHWISLQQIAYLVPARSSTSISTGS